MTWWRHIWHTFGLLAAGAVVVALLFLISDLRDHFRRLDALRQAAQPVAAAQPVQRQPSLEELKTVFALKGEVRQAPKPGTKKRGPGPPARATEPAQAGAASQAPSPLVQAADEQPVTTAYPEQQLPRLPYGGVALPTLTGKPSEEPAFSLLVKPNPRPRFQLGGVRRAGVQWDPITHTFGGFLEHDFIQLHLGSNDSCAAKSWHCGRALVLGMRPFASYGYQALPGAKTVDYGLPLTAAIDF